MTRIEALDQEMKKLAAIVIRLAPLAQQELLTYRTLETQHSQLQERNNALARENVVAEERIKKSIEAGDAILAEANREAQGIRARSATVQARYNVKLKEIEKTWEEADRRAIKKALKELEEVAA